MMNVLSYTIVRLLQSRLLSKHIEPAEIDGRVGGNSFARILGTTHLVKRLSTLQYEQKMESPFHLGTHHVLPGMASGLHCSKHGDWVPFGRLMMPMVPKKVLEDDLRRW